MNDLKDVNKDIAKIKPNLNKLSEMYSIPFEKMLNIIEKDRKKALENYNYYLDRIESGDDSMAAIDGLNKAMALVIKSTDKLNEMIKSAAKLLEASMVKMGTRQGEPDLKDDKTIKAIREQGLSDE